MLYVFSLWETSLKLFSDLDKRGVDACPRERLVHGLGPTSWPFHPLLLKQTN